MPFLKIDNLEKTYNDYKALKGISFEADSGTILGILGPNGAGKTTMIRMITNILVPDNGAVYLNNELCSNFSHKHLIGYMPEERGLYKKMKVGEQLMYLAKLRGFDAKEAKNKIQYWLKRLEAGDWWNKTIDELSKGMSQKVQFIATVMTNPSLIILDEPFSGLDPINSQMIKNEIDNLKNDGATILFSTHRMEQVEEICDSIVLINKGTLLLQGKVHEVKQRYRQLKYRVKGNFDVTKTYASQAFDIDQLHNNEAIIQLKNTNSHNEALMYFIDQKVDICHFEEILPSIHDIFIQEVAKSEKSN